MCVRVHLYTQREVGGEGLMRWRWWAGSIKTSQKKSARWGKTAEVGGGLPIQRTHQTHWLPRGKDTCGWRTMTNPACHGHRAHLRQLRKQGDQARLSLACIQQRPQEAIEREVLRRGALHKHARGVVRKQSQRGPHLLVPSLGSHIEDTDISYCLPEHIFIIILTIVMPNVTSEMLKRYCFLRQSLGSLGCLPP